MSVSTENDQAQYTIERFIRRFQPEYLDLLFYAAIPLIITPELLHYLRNKFLRGTVPWIAEADILLADDICTVKGHEQYVMHPHIRAYLIEKSKDREDIQHEEAARLLLFYLKSLQNDALSLESLKLQSWAAMVYVDEYKDSAVENLIDSYKTLTGSSELGSSASSDTLQQELQRINNLTLTLSTELKDYPTLVEYARTISKLMNQDSVNERTYNSQTEVKVAATSHYLEAPNTLEVLSEFTPILHSYTPDLPELTARDLELNQTFLETENIIRILKQMYSEGRLSQDQYFERLRQHMILDDDQIWWMQGVDVESGRWYRSDDNQWVAGYPEQLFWQDEATGQWYKYVEEWKPSPSPDQNELYNDGKTIIEEADGAPLPLSDDERALAQKFLDAEQAFEQLRRDYQSGAKTYETVDKEGRNLMVLDDQQVWWVMGLDTNQWYKFVGDQWIIQDPPALYRYSSAAYGKSNSKWYRWDGTAWQEYTKEFSFPETAQELPLPTKPSTIVDGSNQVVRVFGDGNGTGFFLTRDGILVTTRTVVGQSAQVTIRTNQVENNQIKGEVIRSYPQHDVVFIKINATVETLLKPSAQEPKFGEKITGKYQLGELATEVSPSMMQTSDWFRTNLLTSQQYDDGIPLLNNAKEVVGMLTSNTSRTNSYRCAVKMSTIQRLLEAYLTEAASASAYCPSCGARSRAIDLGGYYCETCGEVLPGRESIRRIPTIDPKLKDLYQKNSAPACKNCGSTAGYYDGACLRCDYVEETAKKE